MASIPEMIIKVDSKVTEETADLLETLIKEVRALREQPKTEVHHHHHYHTTQNTAPNPWTYYPSVTWC